MTTQISGTTGVSRVQDGVVGTNNLADLAVTPEKLRQPMTLMTSVTASGTAIDFTGIPSWTKRITVMFNGVSTNGGSPTQIQLGSGSIVTSGYSSIASGFSYSSVNTLAFTSGIVTGDTGNANHIRHGNISLVTSGGNVWTADGGLALDNTAKHICSGRITLSGVLDRIRLTTINGTDTFDSGTVNVLYEG